MIAYNRTSIDNLTIERQTDEASAAGCLTEEEKIRITAAHPVDFYTPNIFICVGLFLLTVIIVSCSFGILLLFGAGGNSFYPLLIFWGLVCYAALEFAVSKQRHYKSGVDYGLLWMSLILVYSGIYLAYENIPNTFHCLILLVLSLLFTLRFANIVMALIAYSALLAFVFNFCTGFGITARLVLPFIIMAVSVGSWFLCKRIHGYESCRYWRSCLTVIKAATLISFYLAGNYFIVREMGSVMLGFSLHAEDSIPLGWLFWILTVATPLLYIYQGIRKKDSIFLWVGLSLIAATVFTIRYYYSVLPAEWAMILGGIIILAISYSLIKYLRVPRQGFSSLENNTRHVLENLHLESLVIAETFAGQSSVPTTKQNFQFGGGSGGGGGAGGEF